MSTNAGIKKLLDAEHEAQNVVKEARSYRTSRLKASKTDAIEEVNKYKAQKEEEFKNSNNNAEKSEEEIEKLAQEQSKKEIEEIKKQAETNKGKVIDFLLTNLTKTTVDA